MKIKIETVNSRIETREDIIQFLDDESDMIKIFDLPTGICKNRIEIYRNLYYGIGNTPVYKANLKNGNKLHIKSEYFNSMGNSHYARTWIPFLFIAETLEIITPEKTKLIEITSGNSGIALSIACKELNYDLTMIVPYILPKSRIQPMQCHGANVVRVDGYVDACISKMRRMLASDNYYPCNHSEETTDIFAKIMKRIPCEYFQHYNNPDYIISGLGNGVSSTSFFSYFKNKCPKIKSIIFYPNSETDLVFGLYNPIVNEKNYRHIKEAKSLSDEIKAVSRANIISAKEYFKFDTEISNYGDSSLLGIDIALKLSNQVYNKTFLTIAYDKNDRYL
jgi:cysteine synthase